MIHNVEVSHFLEELRILDVGKVTKDEALEMMIESICTSPLVKDPKQFHQAIFARENLMSTGIGYGIAIPHIRSSTIDDFVICLLRCREGIDYESIDDIPVKLIFMIGASDHQDKDYLKLLSRLIIRLKDKSITQAILNAQDTKEIYKLITEKK